MCRITDDCAGETRCRAGDVLPTDERLPGLAAAVDELFLQVARER